jgi:hypothetical protein
MPRAFVTVLPYPYRMQSNLVWFGAMFMTLLGDALRMPCRAVRLYYRNTRTPTRNWYEHGTLRVPGVHTSMFCGGGSLISQLVGKMHGTACSFFLPLLRARRLGCGMGSLHLALKMEMSSTCTRTVS